MAKSEKDAFEAAVMAEVEKRLLGQQQQLAQALEAAIKGNQQVVDKIMADVDEQRKAAQAEQDKYLEMQKEIERKGDKMVEEYFEGRRKQFTEAARTSLLRDLVHMHLKAGKTVQEAAAWLNVSRDFVKYIQTLMARKKKFKEEHSAPVPDGNPKLRYQDYGRGGTIWYESAEGDFDMWWEFAGGDAMVIVEIPDEDHWEARTKIPLNKRRKILDYVAEQMLHDKNGGTGTYIIGTNVITYYA